MPGLQSLILLLAAGVCAILFAATAVRFLAALRTRRWVEAEATVLTSEPRSRRAGEPGPETVPHIVYEYSVGGEKHRGHQLKPRGVPLGVSDLPRFLARYPAGASAPIYYNPADPKDAVLEREPLSLSAERLGCLAGFAAAVGLAVVYGLAPLHGLVKRLFPRAENEDVLVLTTGLGAFLLLFGLVWLRDGLRERRWPTVVGTVVASAVESFRTLSAGSGGTKTHVTMYRASILYSYEVDGRRYSSRQVRREELAGGEDLVRSTVAKFPAGSSVPVHYNPSNPADAVLETSPVLGFVVLWLLAALMFAVGTSVSGVFTRP